MIAGCLDQTSCALADWIKGWPIRIWTLASAWVAVAAHCAVDDFGVALENSFKTQTQRVHHPGAHVFNHCISAFAELEQNFFVSCIFEIQTNAAFVAVYPGKRHAEIGTVCSVTVAFEGVLIIGWKGRNHTEAIALWGLNLNHICTKIGK